MDRDQQIVNLATNKDNEFTPSWQNRRKVIFISLSLCACILTLFSIIIMLRMIQPVFTGSEIDFGPAMANILGTVFFALLGFAATIIGLYVFGVNLDTNNFRRTTANLFTTISNTPNDTDAVPNQNTILNTDNGGRRDADNRN